MGQRKRADVRIRRPDVSTREPVCRLTRGAWNRGRRAGRFVVIGPPMAKLARRTRKIRNWLLTLAMTFAVSAASTTAAAAQSRPLTPDAPRFETSVGYQLLNVTDDPGTTFPFGLAADIALNRGAFGFVAEGGWSKRSEGDEPDDVSFNFWHAGAGLRWSSRSSSRLPAIRADIDWCGVPPVAERSAASIRVTPLALHGAAWRWRELRHRQWPGPLWRRRLPPGVPRRSEGRRHGSSTRFVCSWASV